MNKSLLLSTLAFSMAVGTMAHNMTLQQTVPVQKQLRSKTAVNTTPTGRTFGKGIAENIVTTPEGLKIKMVSGFPQISNVLNPTIRKAPNKVSQRDGFVLYEDFEDWDGTSEAWLPTGWKVDHKDSPSSNRGWKMTKPLSIYDFINSKCLTYEMFEENVDEWIITPEFTVSPGMELCWGTMTSPYFYNWDYMDETFQLTQYEILNDMTVNVSSDDGETWEEIFSHAKDLIETSENFFAMFDYSVRPFSISLEKYIGKNVIIGFRIVGKDGNTTFLDDVSIGLPLTGTSYIRPLSNLFFGLSNTDENVPASIMVGPVFEPIKYTNNTKTKNADFTWTYDDTATSGNISNDKDLYVTYATDYTSAATTRNNMYYFPVLEGNSEGTAPDSFTYTGFIQAGGKGEFERYYTDTQEYEIIDLGLTIIDPMTEGSATYADIALPYFGYNQESDHYWSQDSFQEYADENNWCHLEKYGDFFYSPDTPIVIEGIRTNAYGKVSRNMKLTAEIYPLNAGFVLADEPLATAICTGNDITIIDRNSSNDFLSFEFKFDEPIVISKKEMPYFMVAIGGFRDPDNVEYFSPEMSNLTNPNNLGLGWIGKQLMWEGTLLPFSWSTVTNYTGDDLRVAFYIMLDAAFPWLRSETDEVELMPGQSVKVEFDSYYDGNRISIENLPEGITAKAQGRYNKTVVTFTAAQDVPTLEETVKVTSPGCSKEIKLSIKSSGIVLPVEEGDLNDGEIYTLDGRKVTAAHPAPGIYILRKTNGKAVKFIQK